MRRATLASLFLLTLSAMSVASCRRETRGMPGEFGPLALAEEDWRCPAVAGRYAYAGEPVGFALAGRYFAYDDTISVESFTLAGNADTALSITVALRGADSATTRKRLVKGDTPFDGDYSCADGWLHLSPNALPDRFDREVAGQGFVVRRRAMRLAPGSDGALVGRFDRTAFDEFPIWCGDGCKGLPLPWTFDTRSTWSRAEAWPEGAPMPAAAAAARGAWRQADGADGETAAIADERTRREDAALERAPTSPGESEARRRATAALQPGMRVLAVTPRDGGWNISLEYEEESSVVGYLVELQQSGSMSEMRRDPLVRGLTPDGKRTMAIFVRF